MIPGGGGHGANANKFVAESLNLEMLEMLSKFRKLKVLFCQNRPGYCPLSGNTALFSLSLSLSLRLSEMKNDASPTFASFAAFGREMVGLSYRDAQFIKVKELHVNDNKMLSVNL